MIYFTSDLHFYHKNIIKYSPSFRDFKDTDEMNEKLIELWNSVVTPEDTVYNLGDLSMAANTKKVIEVAKRLNGKHFLILGNHDYPIKSEKEKLMEMVKDDGNKLFEDIRDYKFLTFPGVQIALSHYPMAGWEGQQHGAVMLHGHLHDYITNVKGKILNVGFDLHGKLLSLDDVVDFTKSLPVLPYRDEEDASLQAIKDERDIKVREKLIKEQLKKINKSTIVDGCELSRDILSKYRKEADLIAKELKESGEYSLYDFACSEATFELFLDQPNPFISICFTFSESDENIVLETALYERLRKIVPEQYEIKISLEW